MGSQRQQQESETMEEVMNFITQACDSARKLESKLPNMANQPPHMVYLSIDDVMKAFNGAKERLLMMMPQQDQTITASSFAPMLSTHDAMQHATTSMPTSYMDHLFQIHQLPFDVDLHQQLRYYSNRGTLNIGEKGGRDVERSVRSKSEGNVQGIETSSSPRPRKSSRKNDTVKKTMMVPALQVGNTEIPPEDGFTWRKYGQKEILGSKYPRGYYRCTHQKLYACQAKKHVQRLDHNPNTFEVTYRGEHTCHLSSTAPSSFPITQSTTFPQLSSSSTLVPGWLSSLNLSLRGDGGMAATGASACSSSGPSDYLVADLADAMFNSGSSSGNNTMEPLFPSNENKWDSNKKKC